jgi:excisionase family DNA binding protein
VKERTVTRTDQSAMVVTVSDAARLLGISRTHAYELVARGALAHVRLGRRIVIPKHALDTLLGLPGAESPPS